MRLVSVCGRDWIQEAPYSVLFCAQARLVANSGLEEELKVLIHGINYAPESMGVGRYTGEMGQWLAARGHEVRVVTAPPYYPAWRVGKGYSASKYCRESVAGADVWRCPLWVPVQLSGIKRLLHLASFAASSFPVMLRQVLWRPNVVILVEPSLLCAPSAWLTARLCGARTWLHIQDFELDAAAGLRILGVSKAQALLYGVERFFLRKAQRVSTITAAMQRRAVEKGVPEDRSWVLPNWSDIDLVRPISRENKVRWEFGAGPEDVLVLYAGNMGEKQGLNLVLDAADQLKSRVNIKFAMVGTGIARQRLEQAARDRDLNNVRFFPSQPPDRLPPMLAAGDIHLVVQKREAADLVMPSKLTNILAAGRPSIATADPDTTLYEVVCGNDCGIATAPESVEELVAAIVALADDVATRERLGNNARQYAEKSLSKDKILSDLENKLHELVKVGV